jgi:hypothetical protein
MAVAWIVTPPERAVTPCEYRGIRRGSRVTRDTGVVVQGVPSDTSHSWGLDGGGGGLGLRDFGDSGAT